MKIPPPPVPARLREILKDYPELIQEIQTRLNELTRKLLDGDRVAPPFEHAIWLLEDTLDAFISRAQDELEVAKASGDPQAIQRAEEKEDSMLSAGSKNIGLKGLHELFDYFETHKRAFQ